jgi:hypothetical protein|tara:strand:+ start:422 stop:529 length:108 start_codon:yes stop_codon:yes gene_type:complete
MTKIRYTYAKDTNLRGALEQYVVHLGELAKYVSGK